MSEGKGHQEVKVMTEKLKMKEKGHQIVKVMPEKMKPSEKRSPHSESDA